MLQYKVCVILQFSFLRKEFENKRNFHLWQKSYVRLILKQVDTVFKDKQGLQSRQEEVHKLLDMARFVSDG